MKAENVLLIGGGLAIAGYLAYQMLIKKEGGESLVTSVTKTVSDIAPSLSQVPSNLIGSLGITVPSVQGATADLTGYYELLRQQGQETSKNITDLLTGFSKFNLPSTINPFTGTLINPFTGQPLPQQTVSAPQYTSFSSTVENARNILQQSIEKGKEIPASQYPLGAVGKTVAIAGATFTQGFTLPLTEGVVKIGEAIPNLLSNVGNAINNFSLFGWSPFKGR